MYNSKRFETVKNMRENKKISNAVQAAIGVLAVVLAALIVWMMVLVSGIQGTARVVNYAGLVRGETQRLVKMEIAGQAEDEMMEYADLEHGSIAIGASETALNIYLLKKLKRFHMEYPGIRIKIYNHSTPQAVQSVKSGEIDFAVVTTPTTAKEPLREVKLQAFSEILVGGKTFTALGSQELSLAEILNYPFICLGRETMTYQFYYQFFMAHGLEMKLDTEAATTDQILPLVKAELGLAFIPQPMAEQAIRRHEIVQICLNEEIPRRDICMVYDVKRPMSVAAKKLKKILLEERDNLDGEN